MSKKVLLLNPVDSNSLTHIRVGRCQTHGQPGIGGWPPIDLALISSAIKANSGSVDVFLYDAQIDNNYKKMVDYIVSVIPHIVILNCTTPTCFSDIELAKVIKSRIKEVFVVFYGLHATVKYDEILQSRFVDCCVLGEPEETICGIVKNYNIDNGKKRWFSQISNIAYLSQEQEVILTEREYNQSDMFLSLLPDRTVLNNASYKLQYNDKPFTIIQVSRGCPYDCIFCTSSIYSNKYVTRTVDSVVSEIEQCVKEYGIKSFMFLSDTFTANKQWITEFCDEIIGRNICIEWISNSRVDTVDYMLAALMKRAGCWLVSLGIESANDEILKKIRKGVSFDQIKNAIKIFDSVNIKMMGYFIFGLPGETKKSIKETITFAKKSKLDYAYFFYATPFPGTELYKIAKECGMLITSDWRKYTHGEEIVINCKEVSTKDLRNAMKTAYRKFYFRPRIIIRQIMTIKSLKILLHNIQAAISVLKK